VGADRSSEVAVAAEQLHAATTVNELLSRTAESFVDLLDAQACTCLLYTNTSPPYAE
jgi:hypothetical protein